MMQDVCSHNMRALKKLRELSVDFGYTYNQYLKFQNVFIQCPNNAYYLNAL